jgi:transcriptional regulator with XRE-family HTH domain
MAENGNRRPNEMLRYQRRLRGWTLDDVAERLHRLAQAAGEAELGVDGHMVGRWERGVRHPAPRYLALLSQIFDLTGD